MIVINMLIVNTWANEYKYAVTEETQKVIQEAIESFPDESDYIYGIADMYQKPSHLTSQEYNILVQGAVQAFLDFKSEINSEKICPYVLAPVLDYEMYMQAIQIVSDAVVSLQALGLTHTAEALAYSRVYDYDLVGTIYEKDPMIYDNDEWANALYWYSGLEGECFSRFEEEAILPEKRAGYFSGSYEYKIPDDLLGSDRTLLDMAMQLHNVYYSVTYSARSEDLNDGYYMHIYIWDTYDFLNENIGETYGNIVVGLANNNCATYQEAGYIHEFDIKIMCDF